MLSKPMSPSEIDAFRERMLPDDVIEAVNICLAEAKSTKDSRVVTISMHKIAYAWRDLHPHNYEFKKRWYSIIPVFEKAGWSIEEDDCTFIFRVAGGQK